MVTQNTTDIIRTTTSVGGIQVFVRDYYTGRGPARLMGVGLALLAWLILAWLFLSPASLKRASPGALIFGVSVLGLLGFAPILLTYRALFGRPIIVQLDDTGITHNQRFTPWSEVLQIGGHWYWSERGYQLDCYYKKSGGLRHLLTIDRALTLTEYRGLIVNLRKMSERIGADIVIVD